MYALTKKANRNGVDIEREIDKQQDELVRASDSLEQLRVKPSDDIRTAADVLKFWVFLDRASTNCSKYKQIGKRP